MVKLRLLLVPLLALPLLSCANFGYYAQAVNGHLEVYSQSRPIEQILADPATDPMLRQKLTAVLSVREFATNELGLKLNDSYREYVDLKRPYVLWNVFATDEFSLRP